VCGEAERASAGRDDDSSAVKGGAKGVERCRVVWRRRILQKGECVEEDSFDMCIGLGGRGCPFSKDSYSGA
jgi:hypothetical protein